jgi:glucan endo-1,6-beta-glucosidase
MTALSHLDPAFSNVVAIEAVDEPIINATLTPGYGNCAYILFFLH